MQVARWITQFTGNGAVWDIRRAPAVRLCGATRQKCLLAQMHALHGALAGTTTRKLCKRAFKVHGDTRFELLSGISNGHPYNLRSHKTYQTEE